MAIESPGYKILRKDNRFEIREYADYIVAEVEVEGDFGAALQNGFRILADYIFGDNTSQSRIAMTVPVTEQPVSGEKIDMTAPVLSSSIEEGKKYRIAFSMPAKYTLQNLPEPVNKVISFRKVASHKVAALSFSGTLSNKLAGSKAKELETWMAENKLSKKHSLTFAQYNPPWIPGVFRRNEVLAELLD
jgi:hypothetical protein